MRFTSLFTGQSMEDEASRLKGLRDEHVTWTPFSYAAEAHLLSTL